MTLIFCECTSFKTNLITVYSQPVFRDHLCNEEKVAL